MKYLTYTLCLEAFLMEILTTGLAAADPGPATGPLRASSDNPRYFTDGSGRLIYLTGSHHGWELQDYSWGKEITFDYDAFLDFLVEHNHNLVRLWVVENTRWDEDMITVAFPMLYSRTGPGTALDGGLKFDLSQFDQDYFDRLRSRVIAAGKRGLYVMIMLFQGFSVHKNGKGRNPWMGHPFNRSNNINGIDGDLNGDGEGREVHTLGNPAITALQEAYVRKVIDTVNDLDNVLYEISNESMSESRDWQYHMTSFIHGYEADKPSRHPVVINGYGKGLSNSDLFGSPAEAIAPRHEPGQDYRDNPPAADGRKVIIIDSDHFAPFRKDPEWIWKCFLRGLNPIALDSEDPDNADFEAIRRAMGHTRTLANRINLAAMVPRSDLASTGYCLADAGKEYLVYLPSGGTATVDLPDAPGVFTVEWFNPRAGKMLKGGIAEGAARRSFKAPFDGHAVLYLKNKEGEDG